MMNDAIAADEMTELLYVAESSDPVTVRDIGLELVEKFECAGLVTIRWESRLLCRGTVHMTTDGLDAIEAARAAHQSA